MLYLNNASGICYCVLCDSESLIQGDFIPLFVIHVWHPRFPSNGVKTYWNWFWPMLLACKSIVVYPFVSLSCPESLQMFDLFLQVHRMAAEQAWCQHGAKPRPNATPWGHAWVPRWSAEAWACDGAAQQGAVGVGHAGDEVPRASQGSAGGEHKCLTNGGISLIMLDNFQTSAASIRSQKWFMETGQTITIASQIHGSLHYS